MTIEYNGVKMVPMMKDVRDMLTVPRFLRAAPSGGFKYYVHYANDRFGTINNINVKEIWPNAFNTGMERGSSGSFSDAVPVGNIGTLLYIPDISYMPSAGHINGTGNVRAESASYSNGTFTIKTLGMSSAFRLVQYTQTPEVSWPYNEKWRLQTDGSFYDNDLYEFNVFAYILLNVYNMDLSLGSNPFRWNVYSKYRESGVIKTGENNCTQDVTAQKVIDGASYETWLIKSRKSSSKGYRLVPDLPFQSNYPYSISNLDYIEFPKLLIDVTENTGWFQVTAMGMELWCSQYPPN